MSESPGSRAGRPAPAAGAAAGGFSDEDYKREVLEPARAAGDQPPEDLRVRYRLREPLIPSEVSARVKQVRQCWRRARGQLKYRKLIDRLEAEHRTLTPLFTAADRGDLGPLAARLRGAEELTARRRADVRSRLVDAAGALRLVTPADVEGIARSGGVPRDELAALAGTDRIEIRDPDALPPAPPYAGYRRVRESLDVLGDRHLADFVFGKRLTGPLRVFGGFSAPGVHLDKAAVARAADRWARRPRDSSTTHADTVLVALRSEAGRLLGLDELIMYDVVDRLRERHRQHASERALLRHAVDGLGMDPSDARRLVFAVLREDGPPGGLAGRLRALLDAGEVHAAAALADRARPPGPGTPAAPPDEPPAAGPQAPFTATPAAPGPAASFPATPAASGQAAGEAAGVADPGTGAGDAGAAEEVAVLAAEARQRLAAAVGLRDAAAAETDPDRAWRLLADALQLVRDLPGAEEHQRRLAPHPVPWLRTAVDDGGTAVRLSWSPSPSTVGEVGYRIVRRRDRPPQDAEDGEPVAGPHDDRPPVNVPLFYGVIAQRGEAAAEPATAGPVFVRPEPREVELTPGDGVVTGRWHCPVEAARTLVSRDSAPVAAEREGFREPVPNGVTCHYRISAVYLGPGGREVVTPGVRVSVTPDAAPDPVYELTAEPDPADPGRVLLAFEQPRHGIAEILLLNEPPPWPRSALLPVAEVWRAGRRVPSTPTAAGLAVRPGGGGWLLAVTVAGDTAAIGARHRHIDLPAPRGLVAERRGAALHVGFDWPADVPEIELACRVGGAAARHGVVTRAVYEAHGGIRLDVPETDAIEVSVAAAAGVGGTRVTGPAAVATVPARRVVHYDVRRTGPPWRRTLVVTLTTERPVRIGRLDLVLRAGRVMPQRPADGETIGSWTEVPVPGEVSVPAPARSGPYWLRCFADTPDDDTGGARDTEAPGGTAGIVNAVSSRGEPFRGALRGGLRGGTAPPGPGSDPVEPIVELVDPPVRRLQHVR